MIIHNFDFTGADCCPLKYDPPLVIDADAVKTSQIIFEFFSLLFGGAFKSSRTLAYAIMSSLRIATFATARHPTFLGTVPVK